MKKEDEKHIYTMQKLEFGGKTTSEKVEEVKGVHWVYWAIVVAIVALIANTSQGIMAAMGGTHFACIYGWSDVFMPFTIAPLAAFLPLLTYPLSKLIKRFSLSVTSLAFLYVIGLIIAYTIGNWVDVWMSIPAGNILRVHFSSEQLKSILQTLWFMPPERAIVPLIAGNATPDWIAWTPALVASFLYGLVFFLPSLSITLLFRRRWIDIEKMPFPVAIAQWEAVKGIMPGQNRRIRLPFIIGLIVGLLFNFQMFMTWLFPWWPDVLSWRTPWTSANGCTNVPQGDLLGSTIVAWGRWNKQPLNFVIAYLAPLDVSFGYWFCTVIFMILAQVAYYFGYYTGVLDLTGCCRLLGFGPGFKSSPWWGPPLYWNWLCLTGGMVAIVVMSLWYSRNYLAETVRAAMGKAPPEIEAKEPLKYKTVYITLIASCIVLVLFLLTLGIHIDTAFILLIFSACIFPIAETYAYGLSGCAYGQGRIQWTTWALRFKWPTAPQPYTLDYFMSAEILYRGTNTASSGVGETWAMIPAHCFRIADMTGVRTKNMFKLILMTFLIALPISLILRVEWAHILGTARMRLCSSPWDCSAAGAAQWNTAPPPGEIAMAAGAGFIVTLLLSIIRARFIWWPIHPMGFLLSGGMRSTWTGAWTNFLGAWIAKWLTLRIGGSRAYEEYGIPFVGGYMVGLAILTFVGIIVGTIRWFIPF